MKQHKAVKQVKQHEAHTNSGAFQIIEHAKAGTPKKTMRGETCSSKQIDGEPYETPVKDTMCKPVGDFENPTAGSSSDKLTLKEDQLARIAEKK